MILYGLLIGLSALFALPFLWQISAAFKTNAQILEPGLNLIPEPFQPGNFTKALGAAPFGDAPPTK